MQKTTTVHLFHSEQLKEFLQQDFGALLDEKKHPQLGLHDEFSKTALAPFTVASVHRSTGDDYFVRVRLGKQKQEAARAALAGEIRKAFGKEVVNPEHLDPFASVTMMVHTDKGLFVNPGFVDVQGKLPRVEYKAARFTPQRMKAYKSLLRRQRRR